MSEWWTYTLSDLILFSSHAYYRLIELYNAAIWPAQLLAVAVGIAVLVLARRAGPVASRWAGVLLAVCWLWIGAMCHIVRYATFNTAAPYFGWIFALEALLLIAKRIDFDRKDRAAYAIFLFALLVMPLAAPLLGRGWRAAEVFGVAPDPTAVGTLGILLLARARRRWVLMVLPACWCFVTGAIL